MAASGFSGVVADSPFAPADAFFGPFGREPFFAAERNNTDPVFSVYAHIEIDEK